jgi:hypothetical protein
MKHGHKDKKLKSLGILRKADKTKPRSPDMTGQLTIQRHTFEAIAKDFKTGSKVALCNIAGWRNTDKTGGGCLNIELSARFRPSEREEDGSDIFDFLFSQDDD